MCKAKKKQIDWSTDGLMNWIKVVAHRSVGGGSCSRRVVGVRAFRRFFALCSPVSHLLSLVARSRNQLALPPITSLLSHDTSFAPCCLCINPTTRWPIDPTSLIASAPALLLFPHAHPAHIRDRCRISNVASLRRQTITTHPLPLTLARDLSLLSRIISDCFVCCLAARNQTPWLRTSRASPSRSHATSSSLTATKSHHKHLLDPRPL